MENQVNNPASSTEQANRIERVELERDPQNEELQIEDLSSFPEDPENEDLFQNNLIITEEEDQEGRETAPLAQDLENGYYNEADGTGIDDLNMPGDQVDDYYEQLGHKAERNANTLDKKTYDSIPKPR